MNHCGIQESPFSGQDEIRSSVSGPMSDRRDQMICPKPRRIGLLNTSVYDHHSPPMSLIRWHLSHQVEMCDSNSNAGTELFDALLVKGGSSLEQGTHMASSPPYLFGAPPSRVANPLIQDVRFGDEEIMSSIFFPCFPAPAPFLGQAPSSPSSSSGIKVGCVRTNFGNKPAVSIEGFDSLDRDSRNCLATLA